MQITTTRRIVCGIWVAGSFIAGFCGVMPVRAEMIYSFDEKSDPLLKQVVFSSPIARQSSIQSTTQAGPLSSPWDCGVARSPSQACPEPQALGTLLAQHALREWATRTSSTIPTWEAGPATGDREGFQNLAIGSLDSSGLHPMDTLPQSSARSMEVSRLPVAALGGLVAFLAMLCLRSSGVQLRLDRR